MEVKVHYYVVAKWGLLFLSLLTANLSYVNAQNVTFEKNSFQKNETDDFVKLSEDALLSNFFRSLHRNLNSENTI
ncbi:hypothetical protein ACFS5J_00775 [Flavobacterium chuncheonense]|uniref:Uncharacterized protein n=1 Tax=Flavobacterium chuncheonense TaxID=2026653 RepID=A0ABW5YI17_9FLAO